MCEGVFRVMSTGYVSSGVSRLTRRVSIVFATAPRKLYTSLVGRRVLSGAGVVSLDTSFHLGSIGICRR